MQKKIIALAVAGLVSGAAFAQSNVTIYGVADVGVESSNSGNGSQFRVQSGQSAGSRLGFKGEEALGNGLKAIWTLEMGMDMSNGNSTCHSTNTASCTTAAVPPTGNATHNNTTSSNIFQRQAFAGLSSNYGSLTLGRQYTPGFTTKVKSDAFGMGTSAALQNTVALQAGYAIDRLDNSIAYTSPTFSGFNGQLVYSSGVENNTNGYTTTTTTEKAGKAWAGGLNYAGYGFDLSLAYHDVYGTTGAAGTVTGITYTGTATQAGHSRGYLLGGSYDFKVAKLFASWGSGKTTQDGLTSTTDGNRQAKGDSYSIGVKVPFGAHSVMAQYAHYNDKLSVNRDFTVYGVGYEYAFSKRTALYAAYAHGNNKNDGTARLNSATNTGLTPTSGYDAHAINLGVRHSF